MSALPSTSYFWSLAQRASAGYCPKPTEQDVCSPRFLRLLASLLSQASETLGACPTDAQILSAGMRSVVVRASFSPGAAELPGLGEVPSVVLKYFRRKDSASNSGGFGYLREKHGLAVLNYLAPGTYPALCSAQDQARLLVLEDIDSISPDPGLIPLHSLLASHNPQDRAYGVSLYLHFWAYMISSPAQEVARTDFAGLLGRADPIAQHPGSFPSANMVWQGLARWRKQKQIDGQKYPRTLTKLKHSIKLFLYPPGENAVLTAGDFSPHNLFFPPTDALNSQHAPSVNVRTQPTLRGIDAEGTSIHHRALTFAELSLGFPLSPHTASYESLRQDIAHGIYREQIAHVLHSTGIDPEDMATAQFVLSLLANQFESQPN